MSTLLSDVGLQSGVQPGVPAARIIDGVKVRDGKAAVQRRVERKPAGRREHSVTQ